MPRSITVWTCVVTKYLQPWRSTEGLDQQSRFTIVSKELQTTTLSLSTKQSLFKHRYTCREGERKRVRAGCCWERAVSAKWSKPEAKVHSQRERERERERVGCCCEWKAAFLYRLKGAFKEHFAGRRLWVTGDHYLIDSLELCNKLTAAHALTI